MKWLAFLALILSPVSRAETLLGHNLTPTSSTLQEGQITAGTYAVGVGITDQLMVATSPWMIVSYNMPTLAIRYGFDHAGIFDRVTVEQIFFKTFRYGENMYQQESGWTRVTGTKRLSSVYTLHSNLGLQYFADDTVPYSMRPIPLNHTPITWSGSFLHEVSFTDSFGIFAETGLLAFNYPNRYAHVGLSGFYKWASGYVQLGISKTLPIGPDQIRPEQIAIWENGDGVWRASVYRKSAAPIHPEVQVQILL